MSNLSVDKCKKILEDGNPKATEEAAECLMKALLEHAEDVGELARYDATLNDKDQIEKEDIEKILRFKSLTSETQK
jgi:histone H3/H4